MIVHFSALSLLRWLSILFLTGVTTVSPAAVSYDPAFTWQTLHTKHFAIHFHDGEEALARQVALLAEQVHARLTPWFGWSPQTPTDVVLVDQTDFGNGMAMAWPSNRMVLYATPPTDGIADFGPWMETLITHEYAHILHVDKVRGGPQAARKAFGRFLLLFPGAFQPRWMLEGLAVYHETDHAVGIGRGQSSYFDMLLRAEIEQGLKPLAQINQDIATWPAGTAPYLYGAAFYDFIAQRYGAEKVQQLIENYSGNLLPFRINTNTRIVLGKELPALWEEMAVFLNDKFQAQVKAIQSRGVTPATPISRDGYRTGRSQVLPTGEVYYVRDDGRSEATLMRRSLGEERARAVAALSPGAHFHVHPQAGVVAVQWEITRNTHLLADLYHVALPSGVVTRLTYGGRYLFAAWHPAGQQMAAVQNARGLQSLVLLDARGKPLETLWRGAPEERLSNLDWAPDGNAIVAALWRPGRGWNIERYSLKTRQWQALTADAAIKLQPRYTPDGSAVLFSADYHGVFNIQRLDLASGTLTTLTQVMGGAFYPSQTHTGDLYYDGYTAAGFDVYTSAAPTLSAFKPTLPAGTSDQARIPPTVVTTPPPAITAYTPWNSLRPHWWVPLWEYDAIKTRLGAYTSGADALQRHVYALAALYDVTHKKFSGALSYTYDRWYPLLSFYVDRVPTYEGGTQNQEDLQRIQHDDSYQAEALFPFYSLRNRWAARLGYVENRLTESYRAAGVTARSPSRDALYGAALTYTSVRYYSRSISADYGRQVIFAAEDSAPLRSDYDGQVYSLDWREFVHLGNEHVLALRVAVGWGEGNTRPFRLGGINTRPAFDPDNVTVNAAFNKRTYSLRGYPSGMNALIGTRMTTASLEWRFPLRRVERGLMAPPVALQQLFGDVFIDSGAAWRAPADSPERYFTGVGAELGMDLAAFYHIPLRLRLGYAHGLDEGGESQIYLRLGMAF